MSDHMTQYTEGHTVRAFDAELEQLRTLVLQMGGLVIDQLQRAVEAIRKRDIGSAKLVVERESAVNQYDIDGEGLIFNLLAKRQPMGADLRMIISYIRAITDLERCGDEAKKIAKIARRHIEDGAEIDADFDGSTESMGELAAEILRTAVEALDNADAESAIRAAKEDARLDAEYKRSVRSIHDAMISEPALVDVAADHVVVIKALERIGDHAKNIAKYVVFIVQGRDVRHVKAKALDKEI